MILCRESCSFFIPPRLLTELRQTFDCIYAYRAGIKSYYRKRCKAYEEALGFKKFQVLKHFEEGAVHQLPQAAGEDGRGEEDVRAGTGRDRNGVGAEVPVILAMMDIFIITEVVVLRMSIIEKKYSKTVNCMLWKQLSAT